MNLTQTIVFGISGQTLQARAVDGVPSSVTFAVFDDDAADTDAPEFSGTATLDTTTTTTTATVGVTSADPLAIPVASTAGFIVGRKYLLTSTGNLGEFFELVAVSGSTLRARHPIYQTHASGATVASTYAFAAAPSLFTGDETKLGDLATAYPDYRVKWTFTVGGAQSVVYSYFDFVRAAVDHGVTIDDINALAPGLRDSLPIDYRADSGAGLIDAAWRAVQADLATLAIESHAVRDAQALDELVKLRTLLVLAEGGWRPHNVDWQVYAEMTRDNYNRFFERHFQVAAKHKMALDASGAASAPRALPLWRR